MDNKVAVVGIILRDVAAVPALNEILSSYDQYIVGRMGLPHVKDDLRVISIIIDAPSDVIAFFTGKISQLEGVSSQALYA
ncbi:MAG: TM1266 family iron-only hydrogenase system putative regulator [Bacillota bacterium]|jgi:putative iron-only hydrogenase system regulator